MDKAMAFRIIVIVVSVVILFALIALYRQNSNSPKTEKFSARGSGGGGSRQESYAAYDEDDDDVEEGYDDGGDDDDDEEYDSRGRERFASQPPLGWAPALSSSTPLKQQNRAPSVAAATRVSQPPSAGNNAAQGTCRPLSGGGVEPSEPVGTEQNRAPVDFSMPSPAAAPGGLLHPGGAARRTTAEDLLPKDAANSKWAQVTPSGQGELRDLNFMNAGFHIGINTQGQSLRNANMQLRSDPINPQYNVSPWNKTTIEPDLNRRPFEIC